MKTSVILLSVALGLACGCGVGPGAAAPETPGVELRSYRVPEGYESEVRATIRSALGTGEDRVGQVSTGPGGQLLVVAPPAVQRGLAGFVKSLEGIEPPPRRPAGVAVTYWIVLGRPRAPASANPGRPATPDSDPLGALRPALEQIEIAQGPTTFRLLERIQLTSMGDSSAATSGRFARINQRALAVHDEIVANIEVGLKFHRVNSQIVLEPGQFLVLAQTGYDPKGPTPPGAEGDDWTLYYVLRSELEE